jgi:putative transposase
MPPSPQPRSGLRRLRATIIRSMPQSLAAIYLHLVFSTKNRQPLLTDRDFRSEIHAYLAGITKRLECPAVAIGGVEDHVHMLARFGRTVTVSDWVKETKRVSSSFAGERLAGFAWQSGYGVFSVDLENLDRVTSYVRSQEEHHRKVSFQDELRQLMKEHGVEWDERYMWD